MIDIGTIPTNAHVWFFRCSILLHHRRQPWRQNGDVTIEGATRGVPPKRAAEPALLIYSLVHDLRCPPRFLVGYSSLFIGRAKLFTALRVWCNQCLHGRLKPDVLRPSIVGMRESVLKLRPYKSEIVSTTPSSRASHPPPVPSRMAFCWRVDGVLGSTCGGAARVCGASRAVCGGFE